MLNHIIIFVLASLSMFSLSCSEDLGIDENINREEFEVLGPEGCTYFEADVDYERDETPSETNHEYVDACQLSNGKILDIFGLSKDFKRLHKGELFSGDTKINISGATIKEGKLLIADDSKVQMQKLEVTNKLKKKNC